MRRKEVEKIPVLTVESSDWPSQIMTARTKHGWRGRNMPTVGTSMIDRQASACSDAKDGKRGRSTYDLARKEGYGPQLALLITTGSLPRRKCRRCIDRFSALV